MLLTGFGAMGACGKIGSTADYKKKNEIFAVDASGLIAGVSGGFLSSLAVGAIFVSGPVGWTVALVASAVGGYFAQEAGKLIGKAMYDQFGNRIDLLEVTRVGRFCG
ncbi:hypothetical protein [Limnobacter sp.]|uniref:hypothetical protein n=1 Tax=Limnobacter sp. TaxID=2003368 RepID=UPI002736FC60|nr:hypothetical protein [Limnobacter sp.]MDP3188992.1 hypothetical protein [Limnobacter sp.]